MVTDKESSKSSSGNFLLILFSYYKNTHVEK